MKKEKQVLCSNFEKGTCVGSVNPLSEAQLKYSMKKYGKPLCWYCQKKGLL